MIWWKFSVIILTSSLILPTYEYATINYANELLFNSIKFEIPKPIYVILNILYTIKNLDST